MIPAEHYLKIFSQMRGNHLILQADAPRFTILDFNDERGLATHSSKATAIGKGVFERFPDNPNDPAATGVRNLKASLMHVLETKRPHKMSVQKYDIPIRGTPHFEVRYWTVENIPVLDDGGNVTYIIHTATDVTPEILLEEKQKQAQIEISTLSLILSKTNNAVVFADGKEIVQWVNSAFTDFFNLTTNDVVGKSFLQLLTQITNPEIHSCIYQSISLRQPHECEVENQSNIGKWIFAKLETQPSFSPSGDLNAFFAVMTDISEIKKAESLIRKNEQRNRFILGNISEGITIMNKEGIVTEVSPSGLKILGYAESELVGKLSPELIHPDDLERVNDGFMEVMSKENSQRTINFRFRLKDGQYKWLESTYHNFCDEPAIEGIVLTYRDISQRIAQEERLRASEENYRYLFENNPAAIFLWDPESYKVIECNETASMLTGYSKDELKAMDVFDYRPAEEHDRIRSIVKELDNVNSLNSRISLLKTKSGETIYADTSYHKITFYGRTLILALIVNVTEKVRLQKQIELERDRREFEVTNAVLTAQENERAHLGRELHDNINQILTTARLYIEYAMAEEKMRVQLMESSRDFIISAIKEVRELSKTLVPTSFDDNGLRHALQDLIDKAKLLSKIEISTKYDFNEQQMPANFRLAIFRIIQEQLNNIIKHSKASKAKIMLMQISRELTTKHDGLGFKNIQSRAAHFGGVVSMNSTIGKGSELQVIFHQTD
jgi:PAS domain S-box-containing protein